MLNDENLEMNVVFSRKKCKYVRSDETRQANPGEVLTDSNFLGKIKNIILNTLPRILVQ